MVQVNPKGFACNASIPTTVARAVGGFDAENFPHPVMDDIDFGYRVEAANVAFAIALKLGVTVTTIQA